MKIFLGESGIVEKIALACDGIMLLIFLWIQIVYQFDLLMLIFPLLIIACYLIVFEITPERYCFTEHSLRVIHRYRRDFEIPYDSVFNFETTSHDSFARISFENAVSVYYVTGKSKRKILCRPRDVDSFVEKLIENCSEFNNNEKKASLLETTFLN